MRILVVEDEAEMAFALSAALKKYDITVDRAATLAEAGKVVAASVHDAILLDRRLPDGDGLDLISNIRGRGIRIPVNARRPHDAGRPSGGGLSRDTEGAIQILGPASTCE